MVQFGLWKCGPVLVVLISKTVLAAELWNCPVVTLADIWICGIKQKGYVVFFSFHVSSTFSMKRAYLNENRAAENIFCAKWWRRLSAFESCGTCWPSSHWTGIFVCVADEKLLAFCVPAHVQCAAFPPAFTLINRILVKNFRGIWGAEKHAEVWISWCFPLCAAVIDETTIISWHFRRKHRDIYMLCFLKLL